MAHFTLIEIPCCPTCSARGTLVTGVEVYPHRPDLADKRFWVCQPCDTRVGCHPGTDRPLGRMANAQTRALKSKAHEAFDPLWRDGAMTRSAAYAWLAGSLGLREAHMGSLSDLDLARVVELCWAKRLEDDFR